MNSVGFKDGVDNQEIFEMTPMMIMLWGAFVYEASLVGEQVTVTSIRDTANNRVSRTHAEGRAIDARSRDWEYSQKKFCDDFNRKYKKFGAKSDASGEQTPCVYHDVGNGMHFHVQSLK